MVTTRENDPGKTGERKGSGMFYFVEEVVSYTHRAGDNVLPHWHGGYEVIVYRNGSGAATVGREEFNYTGTSLLVVPERREHFERTLTETSVKSCIFRTDYLKIGEPILITAPKYAVLVEKIYDSLDKMAELYFAERRDAAALENSLAQMLYTLRYLIEVYESKFDTQTISLCNNAKKYILANFNMEIHFEILANNIGYSYGRFRHIFVEVVGMGLKAYQQGIRMNNAKKMLTETSRTVQEIARRCGYDNPVCFMNYFKRIMGMTPKQYRRLSRGEVHNKTFNFSDTENPAAR